jgi:hypothetical protein
MRELRSPGAFESSHGHRGAANPIHWTEDFQWTTIQRAPRVPFISFFRAKEAKERTGGSDVLQLNAMREMTRRHLTYKETLATPEISLRQPWDPGN